jgi:hypothetical protein
MRSPRAFVVCKTTSELKRTILTTLYLTGAKNTDSWHARKGDLQSTFPLDVPMVTSPKLSFIANTNNPTGDGLAPSKTIRFGSLEFTIDHLGHVSLSPEERDSSAIFIGMVHSGSPSLHTILVDSSASGVGGSYRSTGPRGCNVLTPTVPITTTPAPENTPALQTFPMVMVQTAAP